MAFTLVLTARTLNLLRAFQTHFAGVPGVELEDRDIVAIPGVDAVVSPANAYGWMCGGVDQVYQYTFGQQIEDRVHQVIRDRYAGRMPVGAAFVLPSRRRKFLWAWASRWRLTAGGGCCSPAISLT